MIALRPRLAALAPLAGALLLVACGTTSAGAPTLDADEARVDAAAVAPSPTPAPTLIRGDLEVLPLDDLSPGAADFARQLGTPIGIAVYVTSEQRLYMYNGEPAFSTESVVKVPIMFTLMDMAIREGRPLTANETTLLREMIEESDNEAATALWIEVGGARAVQGFLDSNDIPGAQIDEDNWGDSQMSAESGARLLGKLLNGDILDEPNRALAMQLMESVDSVQDWGAVTTGHLEGRAGVKNGWYPEYAGWALGSIGYVVPDEGGPTYTIAIFTSGWLHFHQGVNNIEAIGGMIKSSLFSE